MTLHDAHYKHWDGAHLGIWSRRAVIAGNGLKSCLQVKWMRYLVTLCWAASLLQVTLLFFLGQLLIADSTVVQWLGNLSPQLQGIARTLMTWLEQNPGISVRTTHSLLFYFFTSQLLTLSFIAIALAIPHLITRDLSSNAIIVYSSKAIGRLDYLLGKFATVFGLLTLTWLGPVVVAWFLGNLLSTKWHFFWHSRMALACALVVILSSMTILSLLALGVSAISSRAKATVSLWIALWILGNAVVPIAGQTKPWLKHFSLQYNLEQIGLAVFKPREELELAREKIPLFGEIFRRMERRHAVAAQDARLAGAIAGLVVLVGFSLGVIVKKVKPE